MGSLASIASALRGDYQGLGSAVFGLLGLALYYLLFMGVNAARIIALILHGLSFVAVAGFSLFALGGIGALLQGRATFLTMLILAILFGNLLVHGLVVYYLTRPRVRAYFGVIT